MALLGAVALIAASAGTPVDTGAMKVFGHSIKNGHLVGQTEIDLLRHECSSPPCVITQMHCPSADGKYDSVVKLYIDGETMPSIAVTLKELALVGHLAGDEPPPPPAPGPPAPAPHDPKVAPNYTEYTLGAMGATCAKTCAAKGLVCSPLINTGYGVDKGKGMQQHLAQFNASVTKCIMDSKPWWAPDQPGYVCGNDPNGETAHCVGWHGIPSTGSACTGSYPEQCRVCRCLSSSTPSLGLGDVEAADRETQEARGSGDPGTGGTGQTDDGPWGETLFGHTAAHGAVYSTIRVPFGKSLRATITSPDPQNGTFWFIIRGIEKYPITLGDVELPAQARLRVHKTNFSTNPLELVTLAEIPQNMSGAVLAVKTDADAESYTYLEACMRALIDGADKPLFLSSGGEDYFLSAFYFDEGEFRTPTAGLTWLLRITTYPPTIYKSGGSMSAYKTHDRDPLFFSEGLKLVWRNGEDTVGCGDMQHCPAQYCPPRALSSDDTSATGGSIDEEQGVAAEAAASSEKGWVPAVYSSNVWVYEWPRSTSESTRSAAVDSGSDVTQEDLQWLDQLRDSGLLDGRVAERALNALRRTDQPAERLLSVVRAYPLRTMYRVQDGGAARANGARQVARLLAD